MVFLFFRSLIKYQRKTINSYLFVLKIVGTEVPLTTAAINDDPSKTTVKNDDTTKESSRKKLKRSKSELTHKRKSLKKTINSPKSSSTAIDNNGTAKYARRRFFSRKLRKQAALEDETDKNDSLEQGPTPILNETHQILSRKSLSFDEHIHPLPPPPNYEESTVPEITSLPTITWKSTNDSYSTKSISSFPPNSNLEDDDALYEDEQMNVPLLVTVFVIPLYLTLGAVLFNIWENWGFLNSFYFCFTTLTTIGFGDYVPGSSLTVSAAKEKLISASLYILLGLVLIAMCFNLMKEQLSQKFKRIANKWEILHS